MFPGTKKKFAPKRFTAPKHFEVKHIGPPSTGFAAVPAGPGAFVVTQQSNAGGANTLTSTIATPIAGVNFARWGALLGSPTSPVTETGPLDERTVGMGASYPIGSYGPEIGIGSALETRNPGAWDGMNVFVDGSGFWDHWLGGAGGDSVRYPATGPQMMDLAFSVVDAALVTFGTFLAAWVPIGWERDSAQSPDAVNSYSSLNKCATRWRRRYGDIAIVVPQLSWHSQAGGDIYNPIAAVQSFCAADRSRRRLVRTSHLQLSGDNVHYADSATGYDLLGTDIGAAIIDVVENGAASLGRPYWGACGIPVTVGSGSAVSPIVGPEAAALAVGDMAFIVLSSSGATNYGVPTGGGVTWTQVADSPQALGGTDSRLHVWTTTVTAQMLGTGAGRIPPASIADVAGDGSKTAIMFTVKGGTAIDVTSGGTDAVLDTTVSITGDTTTGANRFVLAILAHRVNSTLAQLTTWAAANLVNVVEEIDYCTNSGGGFGIAVASGHRPTAGAYGPFTATLLAASRNAFITIAIS